MLDRARSKRFATHLILLGTMFGITMGEAGAETRVFEVGPGPEDFELDVKTDPTRPRLLVSSVKRPGKNGEGQILSVPVLPDGLGQPTALPRAGDTQPFHPVGISFFEGSGANYLFVIADKAKRGAARVASQIRVYRVGYDQLVLEYVLEDRMLEKPNDLVAVAYDELYVSNFSKRGSVIRFKVDGKAAASPTENRPHRATVAAELTYPNGLATDKDKRQIFVSGFKTQSLYVFERDGEGNLGESRAIELRGHPDNLSWDGSDLIVVTHRSMLKTGLYIYFGMHAPWDIWRVHAAEDSVYHLLGSCALPEVRKQFSGASTGVIYGNRLLASQIKRHYMLDMDTPGAGSR